MFVLLLVDGIIEPVEVEILSLLLLLNGLLVLNEVLFVLGLGGFVVYSVEGSRQFV